MANNAAQTALERLFIYGSLQPGGPNEHVMAAIGGEWQAASITGRLVEFGWGAEIGYPGLVIDDAGDEISGFVFASSNLQQSWPELDEFEGPQYQRVLARVTQSSGDAVDAFVYVLRDTK